MTTIKRSALLSAFCAAAFIGIVFLAGGCKGGKTVEAPFSPFEINLISLADSTMRVLTIYDPADSAVLRKKSADLPVEALQSDTYKRLAELLVATVTSPEQDGVGIAAPQVGLNRRVAAVQRFDKEGEPFEVYPNLHLMKVGGKIVSGREGCLSIPGWRGNVPRYQEVVITYTDPGTLTQVSDTVRGYTAVIFQHETDHLDGILYIDRTEDLWIVEE